MPHCSLEFSRIGLPVAVHSQWNEQRTNCALRIFTNRQHAEDFLATIPRAERQKLARCAAILESDTNAPGVLETNGETAIALFSFLVKLHQEPPVVLRMVKPDLMGCWGPPIVCASGTGIIMWFHPDDGYHTAIVHAKEQAEQVIRGLPWLEPRWQEPLLGEIRRWKISYQSARTVQEIGGVIAEVLCRASLAARVNTTMDMQAKVGWN